MTDAALDDSVTCFTLPFPGVDAPRPPRRMAARRRAPAWNAPVDSDVRESAPFELPARPASAPSPSRAARWFASRLPQQGPQLDDHAFRLPPGEFEEIAWDWRCTEDDVCEFLILRDEDGPARDPGTSQILAWFQSATSTRLDPAERLWALQEFLYRFEPGRRWQALFAELDPRARKLSIAWIGAFEGLVWNERQTLRAIVPTPGSLADEAMPDPMTLRIEWTGRIAFGVGVVHGDLSAFRRDDRTPLPFQVHRTTTRV